MVPSAGWRQFGVGKEMNSIKFKMLIRQLSEAIKQATGYMNLEVRGKVQDGYTNLIVFRCKNVHQQTSSTPEVFSQYHGFFFLTFIFLSSPKDTFS